MSGLSEHKQNVLFTGYSLYGLRKIRKWWSPEEMKAEIDWLKYKSIYGIGFYLQEAEREGYVLCQTRGNGPELEYSGTKKAAADYKKHFGE